MLGYCDVIVLSFFFFFFGKGRGNNRITSVYKQVSRISKGRYSYVNFVKVQVKIINIERVN